MRTLICVLVAMSVLSGCNAASRNGASPSPQASENKQQVRAQQAATAKKAITDPKAVADHLEKLATSIPNVQGANCVVLGNTAIVGINVAPDLDRARVGTVKYSVAEALRKDPYGVDAIVTADLDLGERIRKVREQVWNGRPINGFTQELSDIIGRIVPQMPRDVKTPNGQPPDPSMGKGL